MSHPRSYANAMCTGCGAAFSFDPAEFETFPTMQWRQPKPGALRTWLDWIEHCSCHCALCRYAEPPDACKRDYQQHLRRSQRD